MMMLFCPCNYLYWIFTNEPLNETFQHDYVYDILKFIKTRHIKYRQYRKLTFWRKEKYQFNWNTCIYVKYFTKNLKYTFMSSIETILLIQCRQNVEIKFSMMLGFTFHTQSVCMYVCIMGKYNGKSKKEEEAVVECTSNNSLFVNRGATAYKNMQIYQLDLFFFCFVLLLNICCSFFKYTLCVTIICQLTHIYLEIFQLKPTQKKATHISAHPYIF